MQSVTMRHLAYWDMSNDGQVLYQEIPDLGTNQITLILPVPVGQDGMCRKASVSMDQSNIFL